MTEPSSEATAQAASSQAALAEEFKTAFREHPAAVAIIAGQTAIGPVGLTASSISSVAVDPATLSFSVTRATGSAGGLLEAGDVTVNLLGLGQEQLALDFARSGARASPPSKAGSTSPPASPTSPTRGRRSGAGSPVPSKSEARRSCSPRCSKFCTAATSRRSCTRTGDSVASMPHHSANRPRSPQTTQNQSTKYDRKRARQ